MEFAFSDSDRVLIHEILSQISNAIMQLKDWNDDVVDMHDLEKSSDGMQRLAGNCMLIQAIGEGVKKIEKKGGTELFALRPEIPWRQVMGMRDRISHGYFDLDTDYIADIINNDLDSLHEAVKFLMGITE